MAQPYDIVGYIYQAEYYCSGCIIERFPEDTLGNQELGWLPTERDLDRIARTECIDRDNEATFDSDEFPKVLLRQMLEGDEYCGECLCKLEEE